MCLITVISCDSEKVKYNYIINHSDIRVREKLVENLIAKKIPFKKGTRDIILIRRTDSEIVNEMVDNIQSQFSKKIYFVEFETLNDVEIYTEKLRLKAIPYTMKDGCCPQYYRIEVPPEYYEKADLVMKEFLKNYGKNL
jgi:hypothetical protein